MSKFSEENTQSILSKRQPEILKMVQAGLSNSGIAAVLYISEWTVKSHLQTIFRILGAKNRVDSVRKAENLNIFPKKI
ncbi:MAG: helix-turn-helix transcriptional regulator [Paraglaciecola sp.]|nr:helix-turn-helix transcriptional regulator [Paraglaciecola sp.]